MNNKLALALAAGATIAIIAAIYIQRSSSESREAGLVPSVSTRSPVTNQSEIDVNSVETESRSGNVVTDLGSQPLVNDQRAGRSSASNPSSPTPMSSDSGHRVSKFAEGLAATSERQKEFLIIATKEEQDPSWSPRMQDALASSLRDHYGNKGGLEVSDVRCTRSICTMSAVVASSASINQATDWQAVMGSVMNEPWFAEHFFDASTTMGMDDKGMVYLTYFVRKPGD